MVLPPMLDALVEEVRTVCPDAETKRYADTGPVLEKNGPSVQASDGWERMATSSDATSAVGSS
ncbi:MAG: hypothetical protein IPF79_06145 [Ignavibacteria bacterium]|nr:hypothetical protein [Ignavibacteria bacterium]